jgi:hypothetical protein
MYSATESPYAKLVHETGATLHEVFTAVEMHVLGFWVMTPCSDYNGIYLTDYDNVTVQENIA